MKNQVSIFWYRRDLRLNDNAALYHALKSEHSVICIFIFDKNILNKLSDKTDKRLKFIHSNLEQINNQLQKLGSTLKTFYGTPLEIWTELINQYEIVEAFANHDYEPYARKRDREIFDFLASNNIKFNTYKDQCIFEFKEILKDDGKPYTVFTPYSKKWKSKLNDFYLKSYPSEKYLNNVFKCEHQDIITLKSMGFEDIDCGFPNNTTSDELIKNYGKNRDIPSIQGTSRLSVHLRFGTISIRQLATKASKLSENYLNELIWRDFYMMILWHFPHAVEKAFKPAYDQIKWRNNEDEFEKWCNGLTGYPIVDAGMRELNQTGFMHNRVRMIVASFLTKHLLIDWRWGEAYFAKKLLDFDLSANNGGWQWAASSGCDAAPYFRVFNPYLQSEKFDPENIYIKKWVPEFNDPFKYPKPIVTHEFARKRVLEVYKTALENK